MSALRGRQLGRSWEEAGHAFASVVDGFHAVVVCGETDEVAAEVAVGIARVVAERRKVTIADLSGDVAAVKTLLDDSNLDGVTEAILYGVSFARLERAAHGSSRLFVLPSGTDDVRQDGVYESTRWLALAREFRKQGSLLLLVASAVAPGLRRLVESVDGAIVVGGALVNPPPQFLVLKRIPSPDSPPLPRRVRPTREIPMQGERAVLPSGLSPRAYAAAGLAALVLVLAATTLLITRSAPSSEETLPPGRVTRPVPAPAAPDSALVGNPADSAIASPYAVEFLAANTLEGANFELREKLGTVPAGTISPVPVGPDRITWYRVVGGAYADIRSADSLLLAVRRSRIVGESAGFVVRVPFALLVDSASTTGGVQATLQQYLSRGLPVYALLQPAGNALVYAGAFAAPADAAVLQDSLSSAGIRTLLVYRKGRTP